SRWQAESGAQRLRIGDADVVLDLGATVPAEPAIVWAYLTSPTLRTLWEGPLVIEETLAGGRRGVGALAQCVTGRLATLEEIVDWQPYDHVGWQLAVPALGPVVATADLEAVRGGTRIRVRWQYQGESPIDAADLRRIRADREAALGRLGSVVAGRAAIDS
ncbi:MAG TPA: SRPBCC family protein, partial [Candidatus Limnocylindrales bacterium]